MLGASEEINIGMKNKLHFIYLFIYIEICMTIMLLYNVYYILRLSSTQTSGDSKIFFSFLEGSKRNINYTKSKTKENLNILTSQKKMQIYEILQLSSTIFYILKLFHDIVIVNLMNYRSFNVHSQTNIHPLIFHLIGYNYFKFKI